MAEHINVMLDSGSDTLLGVVGVAALLLVAYAIGRILAAVQDIRFARAWAPLAPVIGGTRSRDNSGAANSSRLTGTYGGRPVEAQISPQVSRGDMAHMDTYHQPINEFVIRISEVGGAQDWYLHSGPPLVSIDGPAGHLDRDPALRAKLAPLDIPGTIQCLGGLSLRYTAETRTLEYYADITPRWALSPSQFREALDTLLSLAKASEEINVP